MKEFLYRMGCLPFLRSRPLPERSQDALWRDRSGPFGLTLAALLLAPFLQGLVYTQWALLLGFLCLSATFLWLCRRASRRFFWRKAYRSFSRWVEGCLLWVCFCPFLLVPLFYLGFGFCLQYAGLAVEAGAADGGAHWQILGDELLAAPSSLAPPPLTPGDAFEASLESSGVSRERFQQEIKEALRSLEERCAHISGRLDQLIHREETLPWPLPPPLPVYAPLQPDFSAWSWSDWGRHLLVTVLKPVLVTDYRTTHVSSGLSQETDLGLSWPLIYPSENLPFFVDIRGTVNGGFSINGAWQSDFHPGLWRENREPFFLELGRGKGGPMPQPHYYRPLTADQWEHSGWNSLSPAERTYVEAIWRLANFLDEELPLWLREEFATQAAAAASLTDYYELQAQLRLAEARLLYLWHFDVVKPAEELLELANDIYRTSMEPLQQVFCREHTFSRSGCEEIYQMGEARYDNHRLYSRVSIFYSDSWETNEALGLLGRQSFFPFSEFPPEGLTEWGTLMHYGDCFGRPPLGRDMLPEQSWQELLKRVHAGEVLLEKNDIFLNGQGPHL